MSLVFIGMLVVISVRGFLTNLMKVCVSLDLKFHVHACLQYLVIQNLYKEFQQFSFKLFLNSLRNCVEWFMFTVLVIGAVFLCCFSSWKWINYKCCTLLVRDNGDVFCFFHSSDKKKSCNWVQVSLPLSFPLFQYVLKHIYTCISWQKLSCFISLFVCSYAFLLGWAILFTGLLVLSSSYFDLFAYGCTFSTGW